MNYFELYLWIILESASGSNDKSFDMERVIEKNRDTEFSKSENRECKKH